MDPNYFSKTYFESHSFLSENDHQKLLELVDVVHLSENKIILHNGELSKKVGIVISGLIRVYDKNDRTVWFVGNNGVFGSMENLSLGKPSSLTYETMEETTMFLLNYEQLEEATITHPNIAKLLLGYWKITALEIYNHFYSFLKMTPEDRYLKILEESPYLILKVKSKDLATFLGVHPSSLSRLKSRHFSQKDIEDNT